MNTFIDSLSELIQHRHAQGRTFKREEILLIAESISNALTHLHSRQILHRAIRVKLNIHDILTIIIYSRNAYSCYLQRHSKYVNWGVA